MGSVCGGRTFQIREVDGGNPAIKININPRFSKASDNAVHSLARNGEGTDWVGIGIPGFKKSRGKDTNITMMKKGRQMCKKG